MTEKEPVAQPLRNSQKDKRAPITPESEGWRFLSFAVHQPSSATEVGEAAQEVAVVPLSGTVTATVDGKDIELSRTSVFEQMPHILYAPPGASITIEGDGECAVGSAPAEGRYDVRVFTPEEMRTEIRGGGAARRQVVHALAAPLPAESEQVLRFQLRVWRQHHAVELCELALLWARQTTPLLSMIGTTERRPRCRRRRVRGCAGLPHRPGRHHRKAKRRRCRRRDA